jgi:hypothetical protein
MNKYLTYYNYSEFCAYLKNIKEFECENGNVYTWYRYMSFITDYLKVSGLQFRISNLQNDGSSSDELQKEVMLFCFTFGITILRTHVPFCALTRNKEKLYGRK